MKKQNADKMHTKFRQNADKMHTKCRQNASNSEDTIHARLPKRLSDTERTDRIIRRIIRRNRFLSYRFMMLHNAVLERMSLRTLQRRTIQLGYHAQRLLRLYLSSQNRKARLYICITSQDYAYFNVIG